AGLVPTGAMVAVNAAYATPETVLADGDVLALLPPVAGGRAVAHDHFLVGPQAMHLAPLLEAVSKPAFGGVAVFLGLVRTPNQGVAVRYLEYEGVPELALRTFAYIAAETS